ncbi:MAG: hypothetical protein DRQ55_01820 [Planctomycetota bacterium]|nr:MAG: hypothetical protein DRQ55_01820 [Planctomycetota bacterium]
MTIERPNSLPGLLLCCILLGLIASPSASQATVYSSGCALTGPIPLIAHSGSVAPNMLQTVHMGGMPPFSQVLCIIGINNTDSQGNPLAIDLSGLQDVSPGCTLNTSVEAELYFTADVNGEVEFSFKLKPSFGEQLNFQFAFYESLSPASIAISPALNITNRLTVTPSPDPLVSATTYVGDGAPAQTLTLSNDGLVNMTVDTLTIFDGQASDFSVLPSSPLPVLLTPGQALDVDVFFSPTGAGPRQTLLQVGHSGLPGVWDPPLVTLSGLALEAVGQELLIDVGGDSPYFDGGGNLWLPGFGLTDITQQSTADPVAGTSEAGLYQTWAQGDQIEYALPLPNATYEVTLHFAETVHNGAGLRVMDVSVEGAQQLDDLDVYSLVGHDTAHSETVLVVVGDGELNLLIDGVTDTALLSALEIRLLFSALSITPGFHDFGAVSQGTSEALALTLTNTSTGPLELASLTFHTHMGAGADFELDLDGQQYVGGPDNGPHTQISVPASLSLAAGQSAPATLTFSPTAHGTYDLRLHFIGNFEQAIVSVSANGSALGHPFLHTVIEPLGQTVDWDGNGDADVFLDGSFSHTHEPGHALTDWNWTEGATTLANSEQVTLPFAVGQHTICLTIGDDNVPQETLADCVEFTVSPVTAIPGVMGQYYDTGVTSPASLLDGTFSDPDWTEALGSLRIEEGDDGYGGSALSGNAVLRLSADIDVTLADSYEFELSGGVDARLFVNGTPYTAPISLGLGSHSVEARFAVAGLPDLPVELLMGPVGAPVSVSGGDLTHDESTDPPMINAMTAQGSTLGGDSIVIEGFGFFPQDQLTLHWGAAELTELDFSSWSSTRITLLSPPHSAGPIDVSIQAPAGASPVGSFMYLEGGPPPINFELTTVASIPRPTSGTWGSDGRLYVGQRFGLITALSFDDDYDVVSQTEYPAVSGLSNIEIMGLTTNPFDPPSPVRLYVAHSQLYAQGGGPFSEHAPYPGQVSILVGPDFDTPIPYITGLPTSNHDHAVNGLSFDNNGDLLICVGSNTNAGVVWPSLGDMDEGPLSAAILKAHTSDPTFDGSITYIETLGGAPNDDQGDSAIVELAPGMDVEVHAPGIRNSFDMVLTTSGHLYATDNGPNSSFGPASLSASTQTGGDAADPDEFLLVEKGNYYGHPNRNRGRTDDRQNLYHGIGDANQPEVFSQAIGLLSSSVNGIDEYRATTFQSQMRDEILVQRWNGDIYRLLLSDDGRKALASTPLSPTSPALGLRTGPGGAVVLMDFSKNLVRALEPVDASASSMVAWDIFPWRAPATGGANFVIGGKNFGPLGSTAVLFDGVPAMLTSVTPGRITGVVPPATVFDGSFITLLIDSGGSQSVIPDAFRWLFVPAGNEPGRWDDLPAMPAALGEVSAGVINGEIYVIGEGNNNTYAYHIASKTWSTVAPRPKPGHHCASEVLNGKWYLFGGIGGGSAGRCQIYDPVLDVWTLGADMPWAASSSASALIDGLVYLSGGMVTGAFTVGDTVAYDPQADSYTALAPMPLPRNHSASGTDGSRLWVFGGRGPGSGDSNVVANGFDHVQVYDPVAGTWEVHTDPGSSLLPLPIGRGGMGKAVWKDGEFYVFGGETLTGPGANANDVYDRVDVFSPDLGSWRLDQPMILPRHGTFPVLFQGRVFLPGGGTAAGFSQSAGNDSFNRQ